MWNFIKIVGWAILKWFMPETTPLPEKPVNAQEPAPVTPSPVPSHPVSADKVQTFCLAIQHREGYYPPGGLAGYPHGTPAYVNHNPGNLRCGSDKGTWNRHATASNNGFCVFPDYYTGFSALCEVTRAVCRATLPNTSPYQAGARTRGVHDCSYLTISQYFMIRDPATDNNDPESFAKEVADKLGVPTSTMMRELL